MQTEDFRLLQKKSNDTPHDLLCPGADCTNFLSAFMDKGINTPEEIFEWIFLSKDEFNKVIREYLDNPAKDKDVKDIITAMMQTENMLSLFQTKMKRIFVSAPMMTSGWAVWKNEPSRMKKIDWEKVKGQIERGEETNETFDDKYILKIREDDPNYYTHSNVSKDSVWHISPHTALYNLTDKYTKPCVRKFVTLRLSNFNIFAGIRFVFISKENISRNNLGKEADIIDKIYKDIVISNLQILSYYYMSIKSSFLDLSDEIKALYEQLTRLLENIDLSNIDISKTESASYFKDTVTKIESMTNVQCKINNIYKKFNNENIVKDKHRNEYASGLQMLIAYLEEINENLTSSGETCIVEVDDLSDKKLEDYYFKQKYLKYKTKYLNLLKLKK